MKGSADSPARGPGVSRPFPIWGVSPTARIESGSQMSRQDANAALALTSFLYGGNAAYIEDLHARYEADPTSVDDEWRAFFQSLKDDGARAGRGPSWRKRNWPQLAHNELTA